MTRKLSAALTALTAAALTAAAVALPLPAWALLAAVWALALAVCALVLHPATMTPQQAAGHVHDLREAVRSQTDYIHALEAERHELRQRLAIYHP